MSIARQLLGYNNYNHVIVMDQDPQSIAKSQQGHRTHDNKTWLKAKTVLWAPKVIKFIISYIKQFSMLTTCLWWLTSATTLPSKGHAHHKLRTSMHICMRTCMLRELQFFKALNRGHGFSFVNGYIWISWFPSSQFSFYEFSGCANSCNKLQLRSYQNGLVVFRDGTLTSPIID